MKAHRMVVSAAATAKKGRSSKRKLIARYDVSVAFFHAFATGKIAVIPPRDLDQSMLWFLNKAMNGTREASKQWAKRIVEVATGCGFSEVPSVPGLFYHHEWDITMSCHGDDFLAEGEAKELDLLDEVMLSAFETKVLPRIGPPDFGGVCDKGDHLKRLIRWSEKGFTWESDPKYTKDLVKWAGLEGGKGVETPTSPDTGKGCREAEEHLSSEEAKDFRSWTGTAMYLSQDRPTIQYAVSDIASGMASPTVLHMLKIKRLIRYLLKYPKEVWEFHYQECPEEITVMTDSDWGADKQTRKSMSSYTEKLGSHLIDSSCARQSVVALSSGEAEYYALTRGAAAGRMTAQIWNIIGFPDIPLVIRTDSTAAKGIANRKGVGRVKHLDLKELWVQDYVEKGYFKIVKESTKTNWADIGTKSLNGPRVAELLRIMPLRRGLQAACLASCLGLASAQGPEDEREDPSWFWVYFLMIHVLALMCVVQNVWMHVRKGPGLRTVGTQTVPGSTQAGESGLGGEPSSSSHGGARRRERRRSAEELTVYVFQSGGEKYHVFECGMIRSAYQSEPKRVSPMSRTEALRLRYKPCKQCCGDGT